MKDGLDILKIIRGTDSEVDPKEVDEVEAWDDVVNLRMACLDRAIALALNEQVENYGIVSLATEFEEFCLRKVEIDE